MSVDIRAIRSSFESLRSDLDAFYGLFFQNLFKTYPDSVAFFSNEELRRAKPIFVHGLEAIVANLENPDELSRILSRYGQAHRDLGLELLQYEWMGLTLLKTLEQCLGSAWDSGIHSQWAELYLILSEAMIAAAPKSKREEPALKLVNGDSPSTMDKLVHEASQRLQLPEDIRQLIRKSVAEKVKQLIRDEVKAAFADELKRLEALTIDQLLKEAS